MFKVNFKLFFYLVVLGGNFNFKNFNFFNIKIVFAVLRVNNIGIF